MGLPMAQIWCLDSLVAPLGPIRPIGFTPLTLPYIMQGKGRAQFLTQNIIWSSQNPLDVIQHAAAAMLASSLPPRRPSSPLLLHETTTEKPSSPSLPSTPSPRWPLGIHPLPLTLPWDSPSPRPAEISILPPSYFSADLKFTVAPSRRSLPP